MKNDNIKTEDVNYFWVKDFTPDISLKIISGASAHDTQKASRRATYASKWLYILVLTVESELFFLREEVYLWAVLIYKQKYAYLPIWDPQLFSFLSRRSA